MIEPLGARHRSIPFSWMSLSLILGTLAGTYGSGTMPSSAVLGTLLALLGIPLWRFRHRRIFMPLFLATLALLAFWNAGLAAQRPEDAIERWIAAAKPDDADRRRFCAVEGEVITLPEEKQYGRRRNLAFILEAHRLSRYPPAQKTSNSLGNECALSSASARCRPGRGAQDGPRLRQKTGEIRPDGFRQSFWRRSPKGEGGFQGSERLHENGRREVLRVRGQVQVFCFQPAVFPQPGDRLRLYGDLQRPAPPANPGQFDYRDYLKKRDINAILQVYGPASLRAVKAGNPGWIFRMIHAARRALAERIERLYPEKAAALFKALLIGMRRELDPGLRDDFMRTGTAHLLSISGLHVSFFSGTVFFVFLFAGIPQRAAAFFSLLAVSFYVLLAGAGIPVQRAGWMHGFFFCALCLQRRSQFAQAFWLALCLLIWFQPLSLTDVSFLLSFISVGSFLFFLGRFEALHPGLRILASSLAVMAGTMPLIALYFHTFSAVSVLANLAAIPAFDLLTLVASLATLLGDCWLIGPFLITAAQYLLDWILQGIHLLAALPWACFYLRSPSAPEIFLYYAALSLFWHGPRFGPTRFEALAGAEHTGVRPRFLPKRLSSCRWIMLAVWVLTVGNFWIDRAPNAFTLTYFALGKNESLHVRWHRRVDWLINTGRGFPSDQARWVLVAALASRGVNQLEGIVLTDAYRRHAGGLDAILAHFPADFLYYPASARLDFLRAKKMARKANVTAIRKTDRWSVGPEQALEVLSEAKGAVLLKIEDAGRIFLHWTAWQPEIFKDFQKMSSGTAGIWLMPAITSRDEAAALRLLDALAAARHPDLVVMPHPHPEVAAWCRRQGIAYFNTEQWGALTFSRPQISSWPWLKQPAKTAALRLESVLRGPRPTSEWIPALTKGNST